MKYRGNISNTNISELYGGEGGTAPMASPPGRAIGRMDSLENVQKLNRDPLYICTQY